MLSNLPFHENVRQLNKTSPIIIEENKIMQKRKRNKCSQIQMRPNHDKFFVSKVNQKENLKEKVEEENNRNNVGIPEAPCKCITCRFFFADQDKIRLHLLDAHGISI